MNNININQSDCLQEVMNFFSSEFINVCTGRHTIVPLGTMQILGRIIGVFLVVIIFAGTILVFKPTRGGEKL